MTCKICQTRTTLMTCKICQTRSTLMTCKTNCIGKRTYKLYSQIDDIVDNKSVISWLVLWAQSTTKDYIRAKHKLQSISKLFIPQVITPQLLSLSLSLSNHSSNSIHNFGTQNQKIKNIFWSLLIFREHSTREPASSRVTYFILRAYAGTGVNHS